MNRERNIRSRLMLFIKKSACAVSRQKDEPAFSAGGCRILARRTFRKTDLVYRHEYRAPYFIMWIPLNVEPRTPQIFVYLLYTLIYPFVKRMTVKKIKRLIFLRKKIFPFRN